MQLITYPLYQIVAKVQKGDIRNTILREIKHLKRSLELLQQGSDIKKDELIEHKENVSKLRKLKKQISIIEKGMDHIERAVRKLEKYKTTKAQ